MKVPFFRPAIGDAEINEVVNCLRSGWLTTGPTTKRFETEFAAAVGARHAVAVNSATAALHLSADALGLKAGQAVLVPTMTFAATAEIVRYLGGIPILVDCDPKTTNMDLADAEQKLELLSAGKIPAAAGQQPEVVGIIPVHVGGLMMDMQAVQNFADRHHLWVIEDAAHAFPAAWRPSADQPWQRCGEGTSAVACYSFYANKTITTGEGGMAVTEDEEMAARIRMMSLHGLSRDAWGRYSGGGSWDYRIVEAGYKYNLTDVASAIGVHQLAKAEAMRQEREKIVHWYRQALGDVEALELPEIPENRIHSWHLFPVRLRLERLRINRNEFFDAIREAGVGCSVHWRPLHMHPYYHERFGWTPDLFPVATPLWERSISLPLFPGMREDEQTYVAEVVRSLCTKHAA